MRIRSAAVVTVAAGLAFAGSAAAEEPLRTYATEAVEGTPAPGTDIDQVTAYYLPQTGGFDIQWGTHFDWSPLYTPEGSPHRFALLQMGTNRSGNGCGEPYLLTHTHRYSGETVLQPAGQQIYGGTSGGEMYGAHAYGSHLAGFPFNCVQVWTYVEGNVDAAGNQIISDRLDQPAPLPGEMHLSTNAGVPLITPGPVPAAATPTPLRPRPAPSEPGVPPGIDGWTLGGAPGAPGSDTASASGATGGQGSPATRSAVNLRVTAAAVTARRSTRRSSTARVRVRVRNTGEVPLANVRVRITGARGVQLRKATGALKTLSPDVTRTVTLKVVLTRRARRTTRMPVSVTGTPQATATTRVLLRVR